MRTVVLTALFFIAILILIPWLVGVLQSPLPSNLDVDITVNLWLENEQKSIEIPLGEYLVGVVAAEMPANFHYEALRAQAVAARTYVYRRLKLYGFSGCQRHNADVCTKFSCCQAYYSKDELQQKWGENFKQYYYKIAKAVSSTAGWIIVYDNMPIDPLFHSTCGGHTENSGEVWQADIHYLQGVECPYCKDAPKYKTTKVISYQQAALALSQDDSMVLSVSTIQATLPKMTIYNKTATGRVAEVKMGSIIYPAVKLRSALALNSTWLSWKIDNEKIVFSVRGYGHGVGMCQYGANGMAKKNYNCQQILKHYYQGVELRKISIKK